MTAPSKRPPLPRLPGLGTEHEILPPAGVEDDVVNLFARSDWSPNKKAFDPRAVGAEIQARVRKVARALIEQARSGGKTLWEGREDQR